MITDPKTDARRAGRPGRSSASSSPSTSTLLMAPQTDEFGTKVALLGGPRRGVRRPADPRPAAPGAEVDLRRDRRCSPDGSRSVATPGWSGGIAGVGLTLGLVLVLGVGIVAAGAPARGTVDARTSRRCSTACRTRSTRRPSRRSPSARTSLDWNHEIAGPGAQEVVLTLAENLELENQALLRRRSRRSSRPSTTATGSTRCRPASRTRPRRARPSSSTTGSTTIDDARCSCRSASRTA